MKKILALLLALVLVTLSFAACAVKPNTDGDKDDSLTTDPSGDTDEPKEKTTIRIAGLKGPTTMGLVRLLADNKAGTAKNNYEFTLAGTATEINPKLLKGEFDMAALPANVAATLYQNSNGALQVAAINTLGVLYIVEKGEPTVRTLADLKGKTLYATGKGTTPEHALRYVLTQNGIDPDQDLTIEWKSEATEIGTLLGIQENAIALLPQPYVTSVLSTGARIVLDLTEEWDKVGGGTQLLTGVLVVRRAFAEANPEAMADFLAEYKASTTFINEKQDEGAALVEEYVGFKIAVAKKAIPYCHITYIDGEEMKTLLNGYLEVLYEQKSESIGGKMPDDGFFYLAK